MEEMFVLVSGTVELFLELALVLIVTLGAVVALATVVASFGKPDALRLRRDAWVTFAGWLLLALEFALAADLVGTAISPTWDEIGQLAVIAVIRTFLGYFLERDIETMRETKLRDEVDA